MSVLVRNSQRRLRIGVSEIKETLRLCKIASNHADWSVGCRITSGTAIAKLNLQYRGKHGPTDCLSFTAQDWARPETLDPNDYQEGQVQRDLGDIILAADIIVADARMDGIRTLDALNDYCKKVIVHSYVHLLGYDHEEERDAVVMKQKESEVLLSVLSGTIGPVMAQTGSTQKRRTGRTTACIFHEDALSALHAEVDTVTAPGMQNTVLR